jgi:hypothetical protein
MVHLEKKQLECPREHGTFRKEEVRRVNSAFIKASLCTFVLMLYVCNQHTVPSEKTPLSID